MKAVRFDRYGGLEVLEVRDVERPAPGPGEVLVAVRAAGINPGEIAIREGFISARQYSTPFAGFRPTTAIPVQITSTGWPDCWMMTGAEYCAGSSSAFQISAPVFLSSATKQACSPPTLRIKWSPSINGAAAMPHIGI